MILGMGLLWILFHYSACTQHSGPRGLSILFQPFIKHSGAAFSNKSTTVGVYFIEISRFRLLMALILPIKKAFRMSQLNAVA